MLQFDISDVTRDGVGVSCQLMVGQSSVPHYQQLEEFTARLAPGEVSTDRSHDVQSLNTLDLWNHLPSSPTGQPNLAPSIPGSVQCSRPKEAQSFPHLNSWPKPCSLVCRPLTGPKPGSTRGLGSSAAPSLLAGSSFTEESFGRKQSEAPQLQSLSSLVATGV